MPMPDRVALGAYYIGAFMVPMLAIFAICQAISKSIETYHMIKTLKNE